MPLNPATLITGVRSVADTAYEDYQAPESLLEAAERWADICVAYFNEAASPPLAAIAGQGRPLFVTTFLGSVGLPALDAAFLAYASQAVILSIPPATIVVPPPIIPGIAAALTIPSSDALTSATTFATTVDLWARTGTLNGVPWA